MCKRNHKLFFEADAFDIQHTKGEKIISYGKLEEETARKDYTSIDRRNFLQAKESFRCRKCMLCATGRL